MNPQLDVTLPLNDPDFATSFTVVRRVETIGDNGRNTFATSYFHGVIGVITAASDNDLDRRSDMELMTRSIVVVTKFEMQGEITGSQPDHVYWRGSLYIVKRVDPYGHFGPGFYEVVASSVKHTDPAILSGLPGQATGTVVPGSMTNFNVQNNSILGAIACY